MRSVVNEDEFFEVIIGKSSSNHINSNKRGEKDKNQLYNQECQNTLNVAIVI